MVVVAHFAWKIGRMILSKKLEMPVVGAWIVFSMGLTGIPSYDNSMWTKLDNTEKDYFTLCVFGLK